jgi:hypothetical protein
MLLAGCSSELELFVDLRTDLVPQREFTRVRVISEPGGLADTNADASASWIDGVRVAEIAGLSPGEHLLVVTLFDEEGVVLDRTVRVDLRETTALTVLATRDCTDVSCDAERTCRSASCVDQRCSELEPAFCGSPECTVDADCTPSDACSTGRCVSGSCLFSAEDSSCGSEEWCNPDTGCTPLDGGGPTLPDENVTVASGWGVEVFADFSDQFTYVPLQYDDDMVNLFSNRPHHVFLIEEPFEPGIGLVATWEVWEIQDADTIIEHGSYFRTVGTAEGPDALQDAEFCGDFMATAAGICVAAGSQNAGDGVFRIELDWSMTQVTDDNNVSDMAFDETGAFDDLGTPTLYWAGPNGLRSLGNAVFFAERLNDGFTEVLPSGDILLMVTDDATAERRLTRIESGTHAEAVFDSTFEAGPEINYQNPGIYRIVGGDHSELPGYAYVIVEEGKLLQYDAAGGAEVIAQSDPMDGWIWAHGVVAPSRHALAAGGPTFYIYEFNPDTEANRVFRLTPP